jgi:FK506-binding nuclear protein
LQSIATTATANTTAPKKSNPEIDRNKSVVSSLLKKDAAPESQGNNTRNISGIQITTLQRGLPGGRVSKVGDKLMVHYVGKLQSNQKVFDAALKKPFSFRLGRGEVITGWDLGMLGMTVGEKRRLVIPPEKAYGKRGAPPSIPANATLIFEVSLVNFA